MNKPVLIIQLRPEDDTSDNEYQAILKYGDLTEEQTKRLRIETIGIPKDLSIHDYSAIIVGGSPFDISTPAEQKLAIQHKIEADFNRLLSQVIKHDFPFLGACSGNGLLGSYLGTTISPRFGEAVGCVTLTITEEGMLDPLLKGFPNQIDVLLGHKEACDSVPQNATLLMTSTSCPVQMFRVANNVYATQFHPEGDKEGFILRIEAYKHNGYFKLHEVEELTQKLSPASTPYAQQILKRFVQRYYKQAGIELQLLDWAEAKPLAAQIRQTVFIKEQQVPKSEEWDNQDESARHIVAIKEGETIATARLTLEGKIGRMAVLKDYRKQGIGSMMLIKLIEVAKQQGHQQIKLWSQTYAQGFYQKHGFIAYGEEFLDAGIPHIAMVLKIN
jgi:GMP synthase (glutamine-hydrolysing)